MPKPRRPAGAGEVGFDEQAHRPSLARHPQLGVQATRDGRVDRARFLSRSREAYRDRGGDEPILRPEGAQRVNRDQSRLAAEFEGRLGPGNADRPWEFSCRNDHRRQIRRGLSSRTACRLLWCGSLSPDRGCRCRRRRYFKLAPFLGSPVRTFDPLLQRRQCSPLLLDDSSLAIERRALVGKKLPQFRNRRVSTRRRLRERGTGKHEQRSRQPGRRAEHDQGASRSSPTPAPMCAGGSSDRAGGAMLHVAKSASCRNYIIATLKKAAVRI